MAVNYRIYQSNIQNGTNGKFYARVAYKDTVDIKQLAAVMQNNCTVKKSDILAVLTELSEVMKQELQNGNRVKIDGLGTFKIGLRSKGAEDIEKFNASEHIIGSHVIFLPESTTDAGGSRSKVMLSGLKVRELAEYESLRRKATEAAEENLNASDNVAE